MEGSSEFMGGGGGRVREVNERFEVVVRKSGEVDCQFADVRFEEGGWCG